MKIEKAVVFGFEPALRGMRNPMESWDKADSIFYTSLEAFLASYQGHDIFVPERPSIGPNDLKLMTSLCSGGPEHRKFMRQIMVWADFTLPVYIWSELDTYHGDFDSWLLSTQPVRDSCSTMHKLGTRELSVSDFQDEMVRQEVLDCLNELGAAYRHFKKSGGKEQAVKLLRLMKAYLPGSYLMKSTYSMNYETALRMHHQRLNHRLTEWSGPGGICKWIETLPYMAELIKAAG